MKNKALFALAAIIFFYSCKKENQATQLHQSASSFAVTDSCTATLFDAEYIPIFPKNNAWNKDISKAPLDSNSSQMIVNFASSGLHADFGSGTWDGAPIGIPYVVVCGSQQKYPVVFRANSYDGNYGNESDAGPYAIPLTASIEGNGTGDAHVIAVDKDNGMLYELYNASKKTDHWEASSGAIFNLNSDALRPKGWTSADAAGLPVLQGLFDMKKLKKV